MSGSNSCRYDSLLAGNLTFGPLTILAWQLIRLVLDTVVGFFRGSQKRPLPPSPACIITGCDTGIGRETAIRFAAEVSTCDWEDQKMHEQQRHHACMLLLLLLLLLLWLPGIYLDDVAACGSTIMMAPLMLELFSMLVCQLSMKGGPERVSVCCRGGECLLVCSLRQACSWLRPHPPSRPSPLMSPGGHMLCMCMLLTNRNSGDACALISRCAASCAVQCAWATVLHAWATMPSYHALAQCNTSCFCLASCTLQRREHPGSSPCRCSCGWR
jgi:hypothetical protein